MPMLAFLLLGTIGFGILLVLSVFGGHGDVDHGDFDHDVGHDFAHDQDHAASGPSPVSVRTVSIFLTVFGYGGALAYGYFRLSAMASSLIGIGGGFVVAAIAYQVFRLFYAQQANSSVTLSELVGQVGQVTMAVQTDGPGEVTVNDRGQQLYYLALSREGKVIPAGTRVRIVEVAGPRVVVSTDVG